jgi:hypothetical protein
MSVEIDLAHVSNTVPEILKGRLSADEWTTIYNGAREPDVSLVEVLIRVVVFFILCVSMIFVGESIVLYACFTPFINNQLLHFLGPILFCGVVVGAAVAAIFSSWSICDRVFGPGKPIPTHVERTASLQKFFASRKMATLLKRERAKFKTRVTSVSGRYGFHDEYQQVLKFNKIQKQTPDALPNQALQEPALPMIRNTRLYTQDNERPPRHEFAFNLDGEVHTFRVKPSIAPEGVD